MLRYFIGLWQRGLFIRAALVIICVEIITKVMSSVVLFLAFVGLVSLQLNQCFAQIAANNRYLGIVGIICAAVALARGEFNRR